MPQEIFDLCEGHLSYFNSAVFYSLMIPINSVNAFTHHTTASNPTGESRESPGSLTNNTCFSNVAPWTGILALPLNSYGILSQFLSPLELFVFLSKKWATICEVHGNTAGTQDELKSNSGIPRLTTVSGTPLSRLKGKHCRWLSPSLIVCHPHLLTTGLLSILPSALNLFTVLPVFPNV